MKTIKYYNIKLIASLTLAICLLIPALANAQEYKNYFANGDWQFNAPLNNDFANKASGWGMSFEGGYYVTPKLGVGLFIAFSTNHKYIPTETFPVADNATITTNQQHSLFQLPFGVDLRYRFIPQSSYFDPYFSVKIGPEYTQLSSYISTFQIYERKWGFYVSPEIGTNVWINSQKNIGLHLAAYYSFATNKGQVLNGDLDKINNIGFRVGLAF